MGTPYVGEIRMFAGNFAPAGWAICDGSLIAISENDVLFNLIGTTYGGDGQETFALPDLRGRVPVHAGTGPGLSSYILAETGGVESVTLTANQTPVHSHALMASTAVGTSTSPQNAVLAQADIDMYVADVTDSAMSANSITPVGGSQPHDNMGPYLCINFIIALYGVYPQQT